MRTVCSFERLHALGHIHSNMGFCRKFIHGCCHRNGLRTAVRSTSEAGRDQLDFSNVLSFMSSEGIQGTSYDDTRIENDIIMDIKCIVFVNRCAQETIVVILHEKDKVNLRKLADRLQVNRDCLSMAPRNDLVRLVGYPQGYVPPFGHLDGVRRVVDERLVASSEALVRFGEDGRRILLRPDDLVIESSSSYRADVMDVRDDGALKAANDASLLHRLPWSGGDENTLVDLTVSVVRKRKLAKRLLFATVVPAENNDSTSTAFRFWRGGRKSLVWQHPELALPCELQCIFGKTLEKRYGKAVMEKILKKIVKGGCVRVVGQPKKNVKNSNDTVIDLVIHDVSFVSQHGRLGGKSAPTAVQPFVPVGEQTPAPIPAWVEKKRMRRKNQRDPNMPVYVSSVTNVYMVTTADDVKMMADKLGYCTWKEGGGVIPGNLEEGKMFTSWYMKASKDMYPPVGWKPHAVVALDAEWRPSSKESASPVSLLQIGTQDEGVFLVDMLRICHIDRQQDNKLTEAQMLLSDFFEYMFGNHRIVKLGFGLRYDIKRMAESYPWMPCFQKQGKSIKPILSHVDVLILARLSTFAHSNIGLKKIGLSSLCSKILHKYLEKEEQLSDWGQRPLTDSQKEYAVADVACVVDIYQAIMNESPDILNRNNMVQCAANLFDLAGTSSHRVRNAGSNDGISLSPEAAYRKQAPKKLPLIEAECRFDDARQQCLGQHVPGGGKMGCVQICLGPEEIKSYRVPRGGAMLEMSNAFLLFINVPSRVYPNTFEIGETCRMSWWSSPGQTEKHPQIERLLSGTKRIMLFCRKEKEHYVSLGELKVDTVEEMESPQIKVLFSLEDCNNNIVSTQVHDYIRAGAPSNASSSIES